MIDVTKIDRRTFLRRGAMGAGSLWALSLGEFMSRGVQAAQIPSPYGAISPMLDETTGLALLQLPEGFRYMSYSWTGDPLRDGTLCPNLHDGMAVVDYSGAVRQARFWSATTRADVRSPVHQPAGRSPTPTMAAAARQISCSMRRRSAGRMPGPRLPGPFVTARAA